MSALIATLAQLHFLRPWWLLALLPLLAWAILLTARARRRSVWQDAVDPHLLRHLLDDDKHDAASSNWPRLRALLAGVLAVLALSGPSLRKQAQPLLQTREPLVVALDLSQATLANDLPLHVVERGAVLGQDGRDLLHAVALQALTLTFHVIAALQ